MAGNDDLANVGEVGKGFEMVFCRTRLLRSDRRLGGMISLGSVKGMGFPLNRSCIRYMATVNSSADSLSPPWIAANDHICSRSVCGKPALRKKLPASAPEQRRCELDLFPICLYPCHRTRTRNIASLTRVKLLEKCLELCSLIVWYSPSIVQHVRKRSLSKCSCNGLSSIIP